MSNVKEGINEEAKKQDSTLPVSMKNRTMSWGSNTMLWLGGCISIGTLAMGSAQLGNGLNLLQLFLAVLIGSTILVIGIAANDQFGYTTGAPYAVHLRGCYGTRGNILPAMLRGLPAIVWYGYQTWLGGAAINNIVKLLTGFDNIWVWFFVFQFVQILLSIKGFKGAKWIGNIGGTVIIFAMLYLLYICVTTQWDVISANLIKGQTGTWGLPFVAAIIAFFGNSTTVMLNASDYSREVKGGYSAPVRGISYFLAMVPTTVMLGIIGAMACSATGIANPINAFAAMVDNKFILIITLCFIIFAQLSTNLASNVIPPAYAFMDVFKMKHRTAVIIIGILAVCTCPWILTNDSSAAGLSVFVKIYSAFFAPIFSILIVDFFILHKRKYTEEQIMDLYDENGSKKGVNLAAIIATIVGAGIGLINIDLSFFTATIPTGIIYYLLMKNLKSCENFRKGTILE